jgi:hypothetical protein
VTSRVPAIDGVDHPKAMGYLDELRDGKPVGKTAAVIGAGGIVFDELKNTGCSVHLIGGANVRLKWMRSALSIRERVLPL